MCKLLRYLHERDTRQQFLLKEQWVSPLIKYDILMVSCMELQAAVGSFPMDLGFCMVGAV